VCGAPHRSNFYQLTNFIFQRTLLSQRARFSRALTKGFGMRFTINPPNGERKEFANLPEREPNDLVRQRLGERLGTPAPRADSPTDDVAAYLERAEWNDIPPIQSLPSDTFEQYLSEDTGELSEATDEETPSWRHTRWATILFLIVVAGLGSVWYFASHFDRSLVLERVTVEGADLVSEREIVRLAAIDPRQAFYAIDLRRIEARVAQHSLVKFVHVRRELSPATIVVAIEERRPVAMLKSDSTDETYIIDRDGHLLRPKLLSGLSDPARLVAVTLLSGVSERDTVGFRAMSGLVSTIGSIDSGALGKAIGELRRTPAGSYIIYTSETQTPIFIGSPFDAPFQTALEEERGTTAHVTNDRYFMTQIALLAKVWKAKLERSLRTGDALYVDARFRGQIILKRRTQAAAPAVPPASQKISGLNGLDGRCGPTTASTVSTQSIKSTS
jgi:hypothetical protein